MQSHTKESVASRKSFELDNFLLNFKFFAPRNYAIALTTVELSIAQKADYVESQAAYPTLATSPTKSSKSSPRSAKPKSVSPQLANGPDDKVLAFESKRIESKIYPESKIYSRSHFE